MKRKMNAGASAESATDRNDIENLRMFKTTAEDLLEFQSNPRSALHTAAINGDLEEVQRLVEAGITLDCGDQFGRTALWVAAQNGHKLIVRYLLQNGSCVNIPDCEGVRPTDIAVREGHWDVVNVFLKHDPEIRHESINYLKKQLYQASEFGDLEVVRLILECGISVNTSYKDGYTPLHVAAKSGHKEVSRLLLYWGANVNGADNAGKTPLISATENGVDEMFQELMCATAVTEISTSFLSAGKAGHKEVVEEILNNGANVNCEVKEGFNPLYVAGLKGHVEVVRELLKHGAILKNADKYGVISLYAAGNEGQFEVVR